MRTSPFLILLFLLSCSLLNSKEKNSEITPVFKAEINGDSFNGALFEESAIAGITTQGEYSYLQVFGTQYSEENYPYNEFIGMSIIYVEGATTYLTRQDTIQINDEFTRYTGGSFAESDGDAQISWYRTAGDGEGFITVETDTIKNGQVILYGTFEMTVVVDSRADPFSRRADEDTLHITNGKYRLLLDDRRENQ